ncbi:L-arabinose isomerase [Alteromonas aestuariivivens]|uniref:L-arabinose isomerase n=2 Tax=Alteromonas aestuariivivens TaxID=1938339 RepID=A0A3D8M757_9ALTE|nr:L-arabinose isomerase [Alteromonas aestuariivivens]RDV25545.1 L-arabinose isomerase [Alteromonas aestuariivivens]
MTTANKEVWFVTGSQHLYGPRVLEEVAGNSQALTAGLNETGKLPVKVVYKDTVKSAAEIHHVCQQANSDKNCVGLILWMHTFSPAKMWIAGLTELRKPWLHLHTQFNAGLPWNDINMNYMNTHQSAHGDREFGFIGTRMRKERKVVVGHWQRPEVISQIDGWCRAALGWAESQSLKIVRFGDNMRNVAVTEGDKVAAQIAFGYEVHAYGLQDLADVVNEVSSGDVAAQIDAYHQDYDVSDSLTSEDYNRDRLEKEARLEIGMERFMTDGGFAAFTNCFENLAGLTGLPGLATQRLMAKGFGYGGEGDWKTAAMVRILKVMGQGREGGTSFMEDYTYNLTPEVDQVLGAHMLEVCPSISAAKPKLEIAHHTIGVKCDVPRLLFSAKTGPAINVSPIDMGNRFRILINEVEAVEPPASTPNLPVASALWEPKPDLKTAAAAWIHAGGAHHTAYTQAVTTEMVEDFAEMAGVETVVIDDDTNIRALKAELRYNAAYYHLKQGV